MIQKLEKLGAMIPDADVERNPLNLTHGYLGQRIVFIKVLFKDKQWEFVDVEAPEYDESKLEQYVLVTAKGNATSDFPTIDVFDSKQLYTDDNLDFKSSKTGRKFSKILQKHGAAFKGLLELLNTSNDLHRRFSEETADLKRFALSLKINGEMVGESPLFRDLIQKKMEEDVNPAYFTDGKKVIIAHNKLCSITGKEADVFGFSSLYNFYAPKTELAVVAGGFDKTQAWKNFPTSMAGVRQLEKGKWFVERYLRHTFCGYRYFLLPEKVMRNGANTDLLTTLRDFHAFSLKQDKVAANREAEQDFTEILAEQSNTANYSLLFYEENNAEFKILASIDNVFPSYMQEIVETKRNVEQMPWFRALPGKDQLYNLPFSFRLVKYFIPSNKMEGDHTYAFLNVVRSIFMRKRINYGYILAYIMRKIRRRFRNGEYFGLDARKGYMLLLFLKQLDLIEFNNRE